MSLSLPQLLALVEMAHARPELVANHLGIVDRKLREHLAECNQVLAAIEGSDDDQFEASLREQQGAITAALTAYSTATGCVSG